MIIIEIEVPMMGKQYDFQIDENIPLYNVKEEIMEIICQQEQCKNTGNKQRLLMWNLQNGSPLKQENSARENGLMTGSRILLV